MSVKDLLPDRQVDVPIGWLPLPGRWSPPTLAEFLFVGGLRS